MATTVRLLLQGSSESTPHVIDDNITLHNKAIVITGQSEFVNIGSAGTSGNDAHFISNHKSTLSLEGGTYALYSSTLVEAYDGSSTHIGGVLPVSLKINRAGDFCIVKADQVSASYGDPIVTLNMQDYRCICRYRFLYI